MRVALLTNFVPPYRLPLFEALAAEVGELRVFTSTPMEANRQWTPDAGTLDVVVQRTWTLGRTWRTAQFTEAYEQHIPYDTLAQLRRFAPAAILTGELGARSIQAAMYGSARGVPVILWATLSDRLERTRGALRTLARRALVRAVDRVVVNGESGARYMRSLGVPDDRMVRLPYSTDMRALLALPADRSPGTPRRLLYVGALSERKGVRRLFDALDLLASAQPGRPLELTMVGDGPLRAELQARAVPANLKLTWIGSVAYDQLPASYASADFFVFPSLGDEWGLVVNEALAAGLPVVGSTYSQAVEELVRDGVNGWTFEAVDAQAIAAALERALATDVTELVRMRAQARNSVRHLTPEAGARSLAECMRGLVP